MKNFPNLALCLAASTMLVACQTTSSTPSDAQMRTSKIDSVLERASNSATARGETGNSLMIQEKMYKRNSNDPKAALQYARALRESDYLNRAALVLAPFANDDNAAPGVKTEYAAVQLALGRYDAAEQFAQEAVIQDPDDFKAYHFLGISLDAKGQHKEAERSFRKGLDSWEGDPTPIMNNLALNLASQGFLEEASEILEKAAAVSPGRREVERNLRIVNALKESSGKRPTAPKPVKKPFAPSAALNLEPQMEPEAVPVEEVIEEVVEEVVEVEVETKPSPLKAEEKDAISLEEAIKIEEEAWEKQIKLKTEQDKKWKEQREKERLELRKKIQKQETSKLKEELLEAEGKLKEVSKSLDRDNRQKLVEDAKKAEKDPLPVWRQLQEKSLRYTTKKEEIENELQRRDAAESKEEPKEKEDHSALDNTEETAPVITVEAETIDLEATDEPIVIKPQ